MDAPILQRIARAFTWGGPNRAAVPVDDSPAQTDEVVSRSGETFAVPGAYLNAVSSNTDDILARGGGDLKLYDGLLDDDIAFSNFQQRRLAVVSREWEVQAGDDKDPRSVEAADHFRAQLKALSFDRICDRMLYSVWYGYGVAEGLYRVGPDGKIWLSDVIVPDRRWFGFTEDGELRFRPGYSSFGEKLPPNKFWVMRTGASHDFAFYGLGLAHWCYWPIWFKRNVIRFWALYLEKLGYPTVVGEQDEAWTDREKQTFMQALVAIGRDRAVKVPKEAIAGIKLMEATRTSSGGSGYDDFVTKQDEALMRVILGQTGTSKATANGLGGSQAKVHEDVKGEIVKADSDLQCESFNQTFPVWLTRWNFGEDVAPPRVYRKLDDEEDLNDVSERDVRLDGIGIKRTEESVREVYGDGYERVEPEAPPALAPGALGSIAPPANENDEDVAPAGRRTQFAAQDVAPLYVSRPLTNAAKLVKWARENGISDTVPAGEMHVTCLYSRTPVDWFDMSDGFGFNEEVRVAAGGPRKVERFDSGAIVLRFASDDLEWSHRRKVEKGASHDYPEYLPHVTIAYDPDELVDLEKVVPYVGELNFGPEIYEEIELPSVGALGPMSFAADDEDIIDRLAASLADEANPIFLEFGAAIKEALVGVSSPEAARVALLNAFERLDVDKLARLSGLPLVMERLGGEAGVET